MKTKIIIGLLVVLIALVAWDLQQHIRTKDFLLPVVGNPRVVGLENQTVSDVAKRYSSIGTGDLIEYHEYGNLFVLRFEHGMMFAPFAVAPKPQIISK